MAFESLSEKLNETFKRLRGKGRLTEADVKEGMREVRLALLEADVSYKVVKDFVAKVTERAIGSDVLDSLTPDLADHHRVGRRRCCQEPGAYHHTEVDCQLPPRH